MVSDYHDTHLQRQYDMIDASQRDYHDSQCIVIPLFSKILKSVCVKLQVIVIKIKIFYV